MTEKSNRHSSSREPESAMAPWNMLLDANRQQLSMVTDAASTLFRSSEAMRKVQQHCAHQASVHYASAAQKLRSSSEPAELMAIQSELMRFDLQEAARYWQQLVAATLQLQIDMMSSGNRLFDTKEGGTFKSAMDAFQAVIPAAGTFFTGRPNGYTEHAPRAA